MDIVISKNGVPIRLTEERWEHVTKSHDYMAPYYFEILETVAEPDLIVKGNAGELIAAKKIKRNKHIATIYREIENKDGFIITAFLTKKIHQIERREIVWKKS